MEPLPRATHVGSLLRPPRLLLARTAHADGLLGTGELRRIERESISLALSVQRESGIGCYTDGEYLRTDFMSQLTDNTDGFLDRAPELRWHASEDESRDDDSILRLIGSKLAYRDRFTEREVRILAEEASGEFKISLPDVTNFMVANWQAGLTDEYPTRADIIEDLAEVLCREAEALAADGVRHVQIDAPCFTSFVNPRMLALFEGENLDSKLLLRRCVDADRAVVETLRSRGVRVGMHLCRGNYRGQWFNEGTYDTIAAELFGGIPVDHWLLEYDTKRAGSFEPLRHVPRDTTVVLGLITTKTGELEDVDVLARRVDEAASFLPLDNLAVSPQCGFASEVEGNPLTWDDQRRKLDLTVATAERVWGTATGG